MGRIRLHFSVPVKGHLDGGNLRGEPLERWAQAGSGPVRRKYH